MMVEPAVVADIDLANVIYSIPEAGEIETPIVEQDEITKKVIGSGVSIEPYMAEWKDDKITDASFPNLVLAEMGEPIDFFLSGRQEFWTNNFSRY